MEKIEVLCEPIKSAADKKLYKTIRLENGLTALLISDPGSNGYPGRPGPGSRNSRMSDMSMDTDSHVVTSPNTYSAPDRKKRISEFDEVKKAACALCVGVGSYSDPPDIQGLAHFVEHMVFMGSEKYPEENEFDKSGAVNNASTSCEVTTFYFEIQEKHLLRAMDMFSQFFVSPLMNEDAMQREREAIESEFSSSSSNNHRMLQFLLSLFPEGHPARKFRCGNMRSLRHDIKDDQRLHRAAHDFRKRHYSAHRMTVAVQACMDLQSLEQYVVNTFGHIPTNKLPSEDFTQFTFRPDLITPEFRSLYYVKPIGDTNEVHMTWCTRSLHSEYESMPEEYISYLLGYEGKGSLLSYLSKKVWALGIYTGEDEHTSMYSLLSMQIVLTKEGLDHIDDVLEAIFSYINMLRKIGPDKRIYEEIRSIEETRFRFKEEREPQCNVKRMAKSMQMYPPEHYITGHRLYYKYNPKGIEELLNCMTADNVNIMVLSNQHSKPINYDAKEMWFGTEYKRIDIPTSWLQRWRNVEPYSQFHLPEKNIYITTDFNLTAPAQPYIDTARDLGLDLRKSTAKDIHERVEASEKKTQVLKHEDLVVTINNFRLDQPNLLRKDRHMEVWYKPDFKFLFPTAVLYFNFITSLNLESARDLCLLKLWTKMFKQGIKEEVYPPNMADLSHSLHLGDKGLTLKVRGYSQKLHLLVELISREMRCATEKLRDDIFEAVREDHAQMYRNALIDPLDLARDVRRSILLQPHVSPRDQAAVVQNITLDELKQFSDTLLNKMYVQILVQGNLAWYDAIKISDKLLADIQWDALSEIDLPQERVHQLPLGESKVRVASLNDTSTNSVLYNYYQGEATTAQDTATLEALAMLMSEPVFYELRTKQQLSYSVSASMRNTAGVLGFYVVVQPQADKFSLSYVDKRVEAFLAEFARDKRLLSARELKSVKRSMLRHKHAVDYELEDEVERNWEEIAEREYQFNRAYMETSAIENIKLSHIKRWVEDHFASGNKSQFRKLSVQVMGHKLNEECNSNTTENVLEDSIRGLRYLDASGDTGDSTEGVNFIRDIESFKRGMPFIDVPKADLY